MVLECVDRGMVSLGESARQAIYWHIEQDDHLKREEIPRKPQEFIKALQKLFGPGTKTIEKSILRQIRIRFSISRDVESFVTAVGEAKALGNTGSGARAAGRGLFD